MILGAKVLLYTLFAARLSLIDLKTGLLPRRLTLPMAGLGILFSFVPGNGLSPQESLLGFVVGIVPLGIIAWNQKMFGFGDAVFAGAIGAFWGVTGLGIALFSGGVGGGMALFVLRRRKRKGGIPLGPFLARGGLAGMVLSFVFRNGGILY